MSVHSQLTGADLHESKGANTASTNTVAVANGSGSTTWKLIPAASLDTTTIFNLNQAWFSGLVPNISQNGSSCIIPIPFPCTVTSIQYVLGGTITTANGSVIANNSGLTMATTSIPYSGSVAGQVTTQAISTNNNVSAGSYIYISALTGSTGAQILYFTITVTVT